jgi:site-specific recombinase XerD
MMPSERHDPVLPRSRRVGSEALRQGLLRQTSQWLPAWSGRLTPHVLRHYYASSLYASGMDLKPTTALVGERTTPFR